MVPKDVKKIKQQMHWHEVSWWFAWPSLRRPSYGFGDLDGPADATHQAQKSQILPQCFRWMGEGMTGWTRFTLPKKTITFLAPLESKSSFSKGKDRLEKPSLEETVESPPKKGGFFSCVEIGVNAKMPNLLRIKIVSIEVVSHLSGECLSFC